MQLAKQQIMFLITILKEKPKIPKCTTSITNGMLEHRTEAEQPHTGIIAKEGREVHLRWTPGACSTRQVVARTASTVQDPNPPPQGLVPWAELGHPPLKL
jgi:hypothetical protein